MKPNNIFIVNIVCPDNTTTTRQYSTRNTINDVLIDVCKLLGIDNFEIFSLAQCQHNEYKFLSRRKILSKVLPQEAIIVTNQQKVSRKHDIMETNETINPIDRTLKMCRLYLRVHYFLIDLDKLSGQTLRQYYEQNILDSLKNQNWLQLEGYSEIFYDIAAKSIWLRYYKRWKNTIGERKTTLHLFLPDKINKESIWEILEKKLEELDSANFEKCQAQEAGEEVVMDFSTKNNQVAPSLKVTVSNDDTSDVHIKETLMISTIKDTLKLPYYGVHYYNVNALIGVNKNPTNCRLGIGPLGITVVISPFFTTWIDRETIKWTLFYRSNQKKNCLEIFEKSATTSEIFLHLFECFDEEEAKYIEKELKQAYDFHTKFISCRQKRNSVGVIEKKQKQ